jgi:WD40 repeat protein
MDRHLDLDFHPSGAWMVHTATNGMIGVYPMDRGRYGWVLRGHSANVAAVRFGPDGTWLFSAALDGTVRRWALRHQPSQDSRVLGVLERPVSEHLRLEVAPNGSFVAVTTTGGSVRLLASDGSSETVLAGLDAAPSAVAVSLDSRTVAAAAGGELAGNRAVIRTWDLASGRSRLLDRDLPGPISDLHFVRGGALLSSDGAGVLRRHDPAAGTDEVVAEGVLRFEVVPSGRRAVVLGRFEPALGAAALALDLESGEKAPLVRHGRGLYAVVVSDDGELVVSGGKDRAVRVGPWAGDEPHLLFGHEGMIHAVAVSADGQWLASGSRDRTIRLWRVPTGVPVQALPLPRFLDRMWQNCHYSYHRDPELPGGFTSERRSFMGWEDLPES